MGDGSRWLYEHNDRNEVTSGKRYWSDWTPGAGQQFAYSYDNAGNRATALSGGDANGATLRQTTYTANALNQYSSVSNPAYAQVLGAATASASVKVNTGDAYEKDEFYHKEVSVSNGSGPLALTATAIANLSGTTATNSGTLIIPAATQSLAYDANGSLTNDGIWGLVYDGENRLRSMTMTNVASVVNSNRFRLEFQYDYLGRRVWKKVSTWNGSSFTAQSTNIYIYDGYNLIADLDGGAPLDPLPLRRSFTWGLDMTGTLDGASGVGGYLMIVDHVPVTDTIHYAAHDGNANVMALVNSAGDISARYEYGPFHEVIRATGPMSRINCTTSSDRYTDWETGLVYHYGRYYSPILGRWINEDPVEEDGGNNLYAFVGK